MQNFAPESEWPADALFARGGVNESLARMASHLERLDCVAATRALNEAPWAQAGENAGELGQWREFLRALAPKNRIGKSASPEEREAFMQAALGNRSFLDALAGCFFRRGEDDRDIPAMACRLRVAALAAHRAHPQFARCMLAAGRGVAFLNGGNAHLAQEFADACPKELFADRNAQAFWLKAWAFAAFAERQPDQAQKRRAFLERWEAAGVVSREDYLEVIEKCASVKGHTSLSAQAAALLAERLDPSDATPAQWKTLAKKAQERASSMKKRLPFPDSQILADRLGVIAEAATLAQVVARAKKKTEGKTAKAALKNPKEFTGGDWVVGGAKGGDKKEEASQAPATPEPRSRRPRML